MSRWLLFILLFILVGCGDTRAVSDKQTVENEAYISLLKEIQNLKINNPNEFLAGHAIISTHINITFDRLIKLSRGRVTVVPDAVYWCPPKFWIENTLLPYCKKIFTERKIYYNINYDCDDFSRDFLSIALDKFRQESSSLPINSLSVAEVWYTKDNDLFLRSLGIPTDDHAINMIVAHENGEVVFIEPQACKIINLTENEIRSIFFVRF